MFYLFKTKARLFKAVCLSVAVCFLLTGAMPSQAFAQALGATPAPNMTLLSPAYTPTLVRGIRVYPDNPFTFDFIVDSGDTGLKGDALTKESEKLIRYFLASLTIPEDNLWVNLSPHEKDRIVPDTLGATEMGHDMLAQDYLLKQVTASLTNPDSDLGKEFWSKVYKKAYDEYGTTNVPVDTFNKVWIMPDKAEVYENGDKAFVVESKLKVMLEEDYIAKEKGLEGQGMKGVEESQEPSKPFDPLALKSSSSSTLSSQIVREVFIPALEQEVNTGKNFAQLRQIYDVIILGYWYKTKLKDSILNKVYANQQKVKGIDFSGKAQTQEIYDQYLDTFKKGVCNMMKVEYDPYAKKAIPRKYFAGGVTTADVGKVFKSGQDPSACSPLVKKIKIATIMLMTVGLSVFGMNGMAQVPDSLRVGQPIEKTAPLPAELDGEGQEVVSDSLKIDIPDDIKQIDEQERKNGKKFEKFEPGKLRPQLRKEIYRFPAPTEYSVPSVLAQNAKEQALTTASSNLIQIGDKYGPSGHQIAGGRSTGRSGVNSREIITVDWQKDQVLQEVYRRIEKSLDPSKIGKDTIPFKVDYLESVYDAIHAAVRYDLSAFADKKGQEILIGNTFEEGGVCRHMGIFVAALLEKLIQDGWLRGKVYYVRGMDHGWAVYQTKGGAFRVFDVAQNYFGDPQKKYFSGRGYVETYQEAFNKVVAKEQSVLLRSRQMKIDYIAPIVVNLAGKLSLWIQKVEEMDPGDPARGDINPAVGFVVTDRKGGFKALRDGESVLLGRESYENRFSGLKDNSISRKHVAITRQGSEISIQDISTNGTTVKFPTASSNIQVKNLIDDPQDISQVLALDGAFFPRNHRLKESELKEYLSDPRVKVLVAKEDENIVAFAIYWGDELNQEAFHLSRIVVDKEKRGEGIGSQVMDQIMEDAELKGGKTITYIPFNEDSYKWFREYASRNKIRIDSLGNLGERLTLGALQENAQRSEGFIDRPRSQDEQEQHEAFALELLTWIIEAKSAQVLEVLTTALENLGIPASPDQLLGRLKANYLYGAGVYKDVFRFIFNSDLNKQFIVKLNRQEGVPLYQEGEAELHQALARTSPGKVSKIAGVFYVELLHGDIPERIFLSPPDPRQRIHYATLSIEEFIPGKTIGQTKDAENNIPEPNRRKAIKTLVDTFLSYNKGKIADYIGPSDFHDNNLVLEAKTEEAVLVDVGARMPYRTISDYLLVVLRYYGYFGTHKSGNALDVLYEKEIAEKLPSGRHWDEILDKAKRRAESLMKEYQEYQGSKDLFIQYAGHEFTWDQLKSIADFLGEYLERRQKISSGPSPVSSSSPAVKPTADELQYALAEINTKKFFDRAQGFLTRLQDLDPRVESEGWSEENAESLGNDLFAFAREIRQALDSNSTWRFLYNTLNVGGPFAEKLDVINPLAGVSMTLRSPDKDFIAENFDVLQASLEKVRNVFKALAENDYTLDDVKLWSPENGFYLDVFRQGVSDAVDDGDKVSSGISKSAAEPHLAYDNPYARALNNLLGQSTPESRKRMAVLRKIGPDIEKFIQRHFKDRNIRIAIVPLGSTLKGYAAVDSDIEYQIYLLDKTADKENDEDYLKGADTNFISSKVDELIKKEGYQPQRGMDLLAFFYDFSKPQESKSNVGTLFLPVAYADQELLEERRADAIEDISLDPNAEFIWGSIKKRYWENIVISLSWGRGKEHLKQWLSAQGVDLDVGEEVRRFNVSRSKSSQLPGLEVMKKIYLDGEKMVSSPVTPTGGIDFNAENLNMKTSGTGVDLDLPIQILGENLSNIQGLTPVILHVVPVADFMGLLGLSQEEQKAMEAQLSQSDSSSEEDDTSQDPNISEIAFHSQEKILALR